MYISQRYSTPRLLRQRTIANSTLSMEAPPWCHSMLRVTPSRGLVAQAVSGRGEAEELSQRHSDLSTMLSKVGAAGLPSTAIWRTARLIFIAAAVSQSWICTRRLPLKRVRLSPWSSFPSPKAPSM